MQLTHAAARLFAIRYLVGGLSAVSIVALLLLTWVTPGRLDMQHVNMLEAGMAAGAVILLAGSLASVYSAAVDFVELRAAAHFGRAVTPLDWLSVTRAFDVALYRFTGKLFLSTTVALIALARYLPFRDWLRLHPLLLLALLLCAMVQFTIVDLSQIPYRAAMGQEKIPRELADHVATLQADTGELARRLRVLEQVVTDTILPFPHSPLSSGMQPLGEDEDPPAGGAFPDEYP